MSRCALNFPWGPRVNPVSMHCAPRDLKMTSTSSGLGRMGYPSLFLFSLISGHFCFPIDPLPLPSVSEASEMLTH